MKSSQIKVIITVLIFFSFVFTEKSLSQNQKLDSLKIELNKYGDDTNKVRLQSEIAFEFNQLLPDSGIKYAIYGIKLSEKLNYQRGFAGCYNGLGLCFLNKSDYQNALEYLNKALKIYQEIGSKKSLASNLSNIGLVYRNQLNFPLSIDYYIKALNVSQEITDKVGIAKYSRLIGNIYKDESLYPKALEFYFKAIKIDEELSDKSSLAQNYSNIGVIYKNLSDYPKALEYHNKALKVNEEKGSKRGMAINLVNIGVVYDDQLNYTKALEYYFSALKINIEIKNKQGIANNFSNIGATYEEQSKYTEALEYINKSLEINKEIKRNYGIMVDLSNIGSLYLKLVTNEINGDVSLNKSIPKNQSLTYLKKSVDNLLNALEIGRTIHADVNLINFYTDLSEAYKLQNNWQKAYLYADSSRILKDSVFSNENQKKIDNLESNFKIEKKDKENEILTLEVSKQTTIRNYLIVITVLILLIVAGFWNRYIIRKKQNFLLTDKNDQLNKANQDLNNANVEIDRTYKEKFQLQQEFHEKEAEIMALKNEMLQGELDLKHKELTALAISLVDKNEYLFKLKEQAEDIGKAKPEDVGPLVRMIIRSININSRSEESWQVFETQFKAIHRGFMEFMTAQYPDLSVMELKVCALLKINLSSKEIGSILNSSFRTVEDHRSNIRKKLNIEKETTLNQFLAHLNYK